MRRRIRAAAPARARRKSRGRGRRAPQLYDRPVLRWPTGRAHAMGSIKRCGRCRGYRRERAAPRRVSGQPAAHRWHAHCRLSSCIAVRTPNNTRLAFCSSRGLVVGGDRPVTKRRTDRHAGSLAFAHRPLRRHATTLTSARALFRRELRSWFSEGGSKEHKPFRRVRLFVTISSSASDAAARFAQAPGTCCSDNLEVELNLDGTSTSILSRTARRFALEIIDMRIRCDVAA
jgi:hypothetical protein